MRPIRDEWIFSTVGDRCALPLELLDRIPDCTRGAALDMLYHLGFTTVNLNVLDVAGACFNRARYERGVSVSQAPDVVDCSSFVKWLYGMLGIWLPRLAVQQSRVGDPVDYRDLREGDLAFCKSRFFNRQFVGDDDLVGHVGVCIDSNEQAIIHADYEAKAVRVTTLAGFKAKGRVFGCRVLPEEYVTVIIPPGEQIERADDLICRVYDAMRRQRGN